MIREYTREAGVRGLERRIADLCRKAARKVAEGFAGKVRVDERRVRAWLGPRRYSGEVRRRTADPGRRDRPRVHRCRRRHPVHRGAGRIAGKGKLTITGQLGEVMQESAQAALSWVRSHTEQLGVPDDWFAEHDVHIHVPAGAIPKDGPSAGVAMATAIASLVRGTPDRERHRHDRRDHADGSRARRSAACARRCSPHSAPA